MVLATIAAPDLIRDALERSAARHVRLCPRQVLGVRAGLAAAGALGVEIASEPRRLLAFVETDGCFVDGVEAATGCSVGHRTLRVHDYGKVAAVFVDVASGRALRVAPRAGVRERAALYAPGESRRYYAQLAGYQAMPAEALLDIRPVRLLGDLAALIGQPGTRVECAVCAEEIMNGREVRTGDLIRCRPCAEGAYFSV